MSKDAAVQSLTQKKEQEGKAARGTYRLHCAVHMRMRAAQRASKYSTIGGMAKKRAKESKASWPACVST